MINFIKNLFKGVIKKEAKLEEQTDVCSDSKSSDEVYGSEKCKC
jgi:hypothetical protein